MINTKFGFFKVIFALISLIIILFSGCDLDKEDPDFIPSEKQLYSFKQGASGFSFNSPTLVNNYIYIGSSRGSTHPVANDNAFYKLDSQLNKVWEYPLGTTEVKGSATLDEFGNIYFVAGDRGGSDKLYSLDENGNFRWSKIVTNVTSELYYGMSNPAISTENIIYVGGNKMYAFDIEGNELWSYSNPVDSDYPFMTAPIIDPAGNIYFVGGVKGISYIDDEPAKLYSLDANGVLRWSALGDSHCWVSSPAFSVDYMQIFYASYYKIFCLNSSDGSIIWEYSIPGFSGDFRGSPAIDDNNNVYIGNHGAYSNDASQKLYAIKSDGSGLLWQTTIGADMYSSPTLADNRVLYIGSEDYESRNDFKRLYAIDMATGAIIWSAPLAMDIGWSSAAISNTGILYIASMGGDNTEEVGYDQDNNGKIYGFETGSTGLLSNAGSPRFHEGNKSTGRRD